MFKGWAKDLTGSSDICRPSEDLAALAANAYVLPNEEILFAFHGPKGEFVFTNEALILVEGESATTTRRLIERFDFRGHAVSNVCFETTGRVDRDCEIKFTIGRRSVSIDIARKEEEYVKGYYKVLVALEREQRDRQRRWQFAKDGLDASTRCVRGRGGDHHGSSDGTLPEHQSLTTQATATLTWLQADYEQMQPRCYRRVIVDALMTLERPPPSIKSQ